MFARKAACIAIPFTIVGLVYLLLGYDDKLLLILGQALVIQELLVRYVLFREENAEYSRRLVSNNNIKALRAKIGDVPMLLFVLLGPAMIGIAILFLMNSLTEIHLSLLESVHLVVVVALLIDPISTVFLEHDIGNAISASLGYLTIILIAIGSVQVIEGLFSHMLLVLALINARFAFYDHFCLKNNIDLTFLIPGLFALFIALLPNLNHFVVLIGGS